MRSAVLVWGPLTLAVLFALDFSSGTVVLNSSVGMRQACPGQMVTFTCTVFQGFQLEWIVEPFLPASNGSIQFITTDTIGTTILRQCTNPQCDNIDFVATFTNITNAVDDIFADMTSTLTFNATAGLNGSVIQCRGTTIEGTPEDNSTLRIKAQTTVQVGFEQTRYTGMEGGSVEVCIRVIEGSFTNSTTLILIDERNEVGDTDTAFESEDYTIQEAGPLTNEGVTIVLNSTRTRGCISINLREDAQLEGTEFFTIELSDNSEAVGANLVLNPNQTVVDILDNIATVGFEQAAYTVNEGDNVTVCATIMNGILSRMISVSVAILPGSASGVGSDFPDYTLQGESGTIIYTFSPNVSRQCTTIQILEDNFTEFSETLSLQLRMVDQFEELIVLSPAITTVIISQTCQAGMFLCTFEVTCIAEDLRCNGIPDCIGSEDEQSCEACTTGDVRLTGGVTAMDGLVDVCFDGTYSLVCINGWSVEEASVVCRQLGFPTGGIPLRFRVTTTTPIEVNCTGSEQTIQECQLIRQCSTFNPAGVNCTAPQDCVDGELRLVGGPSEREGRLEMCYRGVWGSISDTQWNNVDAAVTCSQLGFEPSGAIPISPAIYRGNPAPILFSSPNCGQQANLVFGVLLPERLTDCDFNVFGSPFVFQARLVGVQCDDFQRTNCREGDVRLTYRLTNSIGQVEVCVGDTWGIVCGDGDWDVREADVVCRQLGFGSFEGQGTTNFPSLIFGPLIPVNQSVVPIHLRRRMCEGTEQNLLNSTCNATRIQFSKRQTIQQPCRRDAAVTCIAPSRIILRPPSSNGIYTVEEGSNFVLTCELDIYSYPLPFRESQFSVFRVNASDTIQIGEGDRGFSPLTVLSTTSIRREDAGEYRCVFNNTVGQQTEVNITVNVQAFVGSTAAIRLSIPSLERFGGVVTAEQVTNFTNMLVMNVISGTPGTQTVNCSYVARQQIDIQRRLERIECIITNFLSTVDVFTVAQSAAAIITRTSPIYALEVVSATGFCDAETTEFLSWPETLGGTTRSLRCPNTTTIISRTCSLSGVWESVDPSLCTPFTSISADNITLDNYEEVLTNVSGAVRGAAINEQEQTASNLTVVAAAFARSAAQLVGERAIIPNTTVQDMINTLEGLQQWNESVLQANVSNIVRSFERIVSMFAQQPVDQSRIPFMTENILLVTELQSQVELAANGRSFSSSGQTNNTNISTLNEEESAAAFLPPSLFQSITNLENIGSFYAVYNMGTLFPITDTAQGTNASAATVVGSPVLAATIGSGLNFSGLEVPVRILLRLNEMENVRSGELQCVSWDFGIAEWTTEGCVTAEVNGDVVTCNCNHLTNFAILVDSTLGCDAETTEVLSWPDTPAGTTHSLRCPNTTTIIIRTCSLSGVWESVDPSLCTSFTSINVANITLDNYEGVLTSLSGAVRGAAINEQEQTTDNLAMVAAAFARSAALVNEMTIIPNTTVNDLINILEGLQQWNEGVLQANSSNIVRSFEVIVGIFAQQLEDGERFTLTTETILFVAELLSQAELTANGRSFSSTGQTEIADITTLNEEETAAAFLPPSLFQSITDRNSTGIFFAVYDTGVFFPITNATELIEGTNATVTTVVGSPVLAATVGPGLNFDGLEEPVRILLRLNELGQNDTREAPRCVSWDFDSQEWTTEGCVTAEVNGNVVTCNCNHLTNFAILVDICARFLDSCRPVAQTPLEVVSIVGAVLSLVGIAATVFTLLVFKKLRERDATIFHIQLCIALFCMLIIFVCGIDQTRVYGGCVLVSVLIHYFTLVAVMFMGAEAVLMFKKLIIVFGQTTAKFFVTISLICWLVPIIPVVIPLAIDLSDAVSRELVVRMPTGENNGQGFCFISDPAVFFGAFLGPIFAILIFNAVIFVMVISVLIKHTRKTLGRNKEQMNKKTIIRLLISIAGIMSLFGLTWLFAALTVTGFGSAAASTAFQALFVICNAFQGFFIFLFFCVFSKDARESWLEVLSCGRYHSKPLNPTQAKYSSSATRKKVKTSSTGLTDSNLTSATSSKTGYNSSTDDLIEDERYTDIPLTSAAEQDKEKPSVVTFKDDPEIHETNVGTDKKVDLGSSEVKEKEQALEKSEECTSPYQWREDGLELKARVKRFSTKKAYKHHVESAEVDFLDSDSDGDDNTNA